MGRGDNQRTPLYTLLDPKFAVEPISEVPGASKAHLEVVKRNVTNLLEQGIHGSMDLHW